MKKILAALAAAAMLCCTLVSPVSAEETYRKGDVNMDGVVDVEDAQLTLDEYALIVLGHYPVGIFSEEQRELARVVPPEILEETGDEGDRAFVLYAQAILFYYVEGLADPSITEVDVDVWFPQFWYSHFSY